MKFSITDFFSKCDQIRRKLQIWSYLLKKSWIENFIFCAVKHKGHTQKDNIGIFEKLDLLHFEMIFYFI